MKLINNLRVDVEPLAEGLYQLICQAGDDAIVAHGMIPYGMVELLRKLLREKILAIAAQQRNRSGQEAARLGGSGFCGFHGVASVHRREVAITKSRSASPGRFPIFDRLGRG